MRPRMCGASLDASSDEEAGGRFGVADAPKDGISLTMMNVSSIVCVSDMTCTYTSDASAASSEASEALDSQAQSLVEQTSQAQASGGQASQAEV